LFFSALLLVFATAQSWNTTLTLVDASRHSLLHPHGRTVKAFVCGVESSSASPLYIFGHGFDCQGVDYAWLCATPGVVSALVIGDEYGTPFLPDTKDLALDQAHLSRALPQLAQNRSSPLYGRLNGKAVLGGHSMGGGTSVLAADASFAPDATVDAMALFAPGLYTAPPAYSHRPHINAPMMVVSGAMDCGPNQLPKEALPLYQDVNSTVKAVVVLKGANHCQWSTPTKGGVCAHAECHAIDRSTQQAAGRRLLQAFLSGVFGDASSWDAFESFLASGAKTGEWTYLTMRSKGGNITNNCPCK